MTPAAFFLLLRDFKKSMSGKPLEEVTKCRRFIAEFLQLAEYEYVARMKDMTVEQSIIFIQTLMSIEDSKKPSDTAEFDRIIKDLKK